MNNKSIALNILQANNKQKITHFYNSEFNKTRENKVILLMINDNEKQHYRFVENVNALLKKYACSDNYCINCLKPFRTKQKLIKLFISLFFTLYLHCSR